MPQWPQASNNSILVSGIPLEFEYETTATAYPGMGVTINTTSKWEVDLCDKHDNVVCIVDVSMASLTGRGSWRKDGVKDLPYTDNDQMKCISGPITVMLLLAASETVDEGDKLACAGDGRFGKVACVMTTDTLCALVAEAMEAVTTNSVQLSSYIHAKLLI